MDVTSLYTNIPQEEGIDTVCEAYEDFYQGNPPIPSRYLREMLSLILQENSFQFNGKDYLQSHGTAMGTKMAVAFANIFMAKIERQILRLSNTKPIFWKRFIDDIISMWDTNRDKIEEFLLEANSFHPTIKFTAEISETETTFLDTIVYKGERFLKESILDVRTHFKPTETFQYTNYYSCHPPGVTKGFIKGEALRLLRTNSSQLTFEENIRNFAVRLKNRDYPTAIVQKHLSEVKFSERKTALKNKNKAAQKKILPFVTQYHPALPNIKEILMGKWHLIQNQPQLRNIFKEPPLLAYRKEKSLKDILVLIQTNSNLQKNLEAVEAQLQELKFTSDLNLELELNEKDILAEELENAKRELDELKGQVSSQKAAHKIKLRNAKNRMSHLKVQLSNQKAAHEIKLKSAKKRITNLKKQVSSQNDRHEIEMTNAQKEISELKNTSFLKTLQKNIFPNFSFHNLAYSFLTLQY
ncbi:hypothetical protein ACROYT_G015146 [Oculina patagonica]